MSDNSFVNAEAIKVVLIGESGVGKTSIIKQFTIQQFDPDCASSINGQYSCKILNIPNTKKSLKFDIWDTAGQEKYRSLAKIFYKDAKIIIFVYECTNKSSFDNLQNYWYDQIDSCCSPDTIFALVSNKNDLYKYSQVKDEDAIKWADEIGAIFQSTSAKSNSGIEKLFELVGKKCLNPNFDYKKEDESDKMLYEMKKKQEKNKNNTDDEPNFDNIPDIKKNKNIKISTKSNKKQNGRKCC